MKTYTQVLKAQVKDVMTGKEAIKEKNVHTTEYNNIAELVSDINAKEVSKLFEHRKHNLSSIKGSRDFTGTINFAEAMNLLNNGWDSGAKQLTQKLRIKSNSNQTEMVRKTVYDIVGFQASVPRYLQGVPQNMINKKLIPQKKKVINLYKDICYNARVSVEKIMEDSINFLRIAQAIEAQGVSVNLFVCFISEGGTEASMIKLKIKGSNERLNVSKMAFALAHPSFLRRIVFKYIETDNRLTDRVFTHGYGSPMDYDRANQLMKDNEYMVKQFQTLEETIDDLKTLNKY